jgi:hypothetical protein
LLYKEFVGLSSEPVRNLVERGAVRRFAEAIAGPSPLYVDEEAATSSRYGSLIHGEYRISYERTLLVGDEVLCRMRLKDSYDKQGRRGLLGFLVFERTGEGSDGRRVFTTNDTVVVTESVRRGIEA